MHTFSAQLKIVGVNPYLTVPEPILAAIFKQAGRDKGPVPVHGELGGRAYTQTLVRYAGEWRFYVNTSMLKNSPQHVGETLEISVDYDPRDRSLSLHPKLLAALAADPIARQVYESQAPSRQHEINRYISNLKSEAVIAVNVQRAIDFLNGKGSFAGRTQP